MSRKLTSSKIRHYLTDISASLAFSLYIAVFIIILFLAWFVPSLWGRINYVHSSFNEAAGRGAISIGGEVAAGFFSAYRQWPPTKRYLVLGTDEVEGSNRPTILTDTILLVTYHPELNEIKLLSFPRDLYHPQLQTKINALYWYGRERSALDPTVLPTALVEQTFEDMTATAIDQVLVLSLADVRELIDLLGGVVVDVQHGFTDDQFPRSGVDVTVEKDPAVLYETVSFEPGVQLMSGETALKFMRSRKAVEESEQGDEARTRRQQQVLSSIAARMQSPAVVGNPERLGQLYRWYAENFMPKVSLFQIGQVLGSIQRQQQFPGLETVDLPLSSEAVATDSATLLVHPPVEKYGQWVYEPVDESWQQLRSFISEMGL